jgi:hypothetical protein
LESSPTAAVVTSALLPTEKKRKTEGKIIYKNNGPAYIWFRWQIRV